MFEPPSLKLWNESVISQAWRKNVKCILNDICGESDSLEIGLRANRTSAKVQSVQIWQILKRDNFFMSSNVTKKVTKYPQTWVMLCTSSCKQSIAHTHLETRKLCLAFISLPLIYQCLQFEWCFSYFMFGLLLWNIAPKHFSKIGCGVISCGSVSRECKPNGQQ